MATRREIIEVSRRGRDGDYAGAVAVAALRADYDRLLSLPVSRLHTTTQQMATPPTVTQYLWGTSPLNGQPETRMDAGPFTYLGTRYAIGTVTQIDPDHYSPLYRYHDGTLAAAGDWAVEFDYDGAAFEIHMYGGGVAGRYRIGVVGEGYDTRFGHAGPPADGNWYRIHVEFGTAKPRTIRIDMNGATRFGGIFAESGATISASTAAPGSALLVLGDSYTEGGNADATYTAFPHRLGQYLGTRDITPTGWGGTGYLADTSGTRTKYRTRLTTDVINAAPDTVIVTGGINDHALFSAAAIGTEADLLFSAITTGLPAASLVVVLPFYKNGAPPATLVQARDAIRTAALPYARLIIDPIGGPVPYSGVAGDYVNTGWITGTGYVGNEQQDGNADFYTSSDTTHPTQAGHDYLALRIAEAIAADAPELLA